VEFTHALIALAAKLVAADGKPSTAEYAAFCSVFPLAEGAEAKRRSLFIRAMNDTAPALQYARRIVALYPNAMTLYHELLDRLLQVASADEALNAAEHELLRAVANVFDVPMDQWRHMVGRYIRMADANPYTVLGAYKRMSDSELRARYMAQVRLLHPDRYHAAGASADTIAMLSEKLAAINAAYATITEARASKGNNKEASAG
jgi:DnaJ like chaperone protein